SHASTSMPQSPLYPGTSIVNPRCLKISATYRSTESSRVENSPRAYLPLLLVLISLASNPGALSATTTVLLVLLWLCVASAIYSQVVVVYCESVGGLFRQIETIGSCFWRWGASEGTGDRHVRVAARARHRASDRSRATHWGV